MYWLSIVLPILIVIAGLAALAIPWFVFEDTGLAGFFLSAAVLWAAVFGLIQWDRANLDSTSTHETITVKKAERVNYDESSKYLVYTDKGVFEDTDSVYYWKFNSSDLYSKLEAGKKYNCHVVGWRVHFTSAYRNLIDCN